MAQFLSIVNNKQHSSKAVTVCTWGGRDCGWDWDV